MRTGTSTQGHPATGRSCLHPALQTCFQPLHAPPAPPAPPGPPASQSTGHLQVRLPSPPAPGLPPPSPEPPPLLWLPLPDLNPSPWAPSQQHIHSHPAHLPARSHRACRPRLRFSPATHSKPPHPHNRHSQGLHQARDHWSVLVQLERSAARTPCSPPPESPDSWAGTAPRSARPVPRPPLMLVFPPELDPKAGHVLGQLASTPDLAAARNRTHPLGCPNVSPLSFRYPGSPGPASSPVLSRQGTRDGSRDGLQLLYREPR